MFYDPIEEHWWRILLEGFGIFLLLYFIYNEIAQIKALGRAHHTNVARRVNYIERDLHFCHPKWPGEEKFVQSEIDYIKAYKRTYFRDPWNIFEWLHYIVVIVLVASRISVLALQTKSSIDMHLRAYAVGLILVWLRLMRSCRAFNMIGPFIAVLGSVISDTLRFAILFFEFFIPYTVAFWIIFGDGHYGSGNSGEGSTETRHNWNHFHDRIFSTWAMSLMGEFNFGMLMDIDRNMAQLFCGTYFALVGVVCMNLYIALLSDTFARVYMAAQATAGMQQAKMIVALQEHLSDDQRLRLEQHMQDNCCPEMVRFSVRCP